MSLWGSHYLIISESGTEYMQSAGQCATSSSVYFNSEQKNNIPRQRRRESVSRPLQLELNICRFFRRAEPRRVTELSQILPLSDGSIGFTVI
jgi:hypothetical protein